MDLIQQSGIITKGSHNTIAKKLIETLRTFVDFEQNYSSMRFLDSNQPIETDMYVKMEQIGSKLSEEI